MLLLHNTNMKTRTTKKIYDISKDKNIELFDLTCPNVLRIHEKAIKLVEENYFIVLIAQKDHPEAIGTISFCGSDSIILEKEDAPNSIFNMILDSKTYDVIEYDVMTSITGYRSIVVLVDTKDKIGIGQSVILK